MLEELQSIFSSYIKTLDVLYVLKNLKPVSRIMVKEENYLPVVDFLKMNKLVFERADFKIKKLDSTDYSDKGARLPLSSKERGDYFLYVSKSKELAKKAKELEEEGKHYELGIALGYPACCSRFFEENFAVESQGNNDYIFSILRNSDGFRFPFYLNVVSRHLDLNLISHFPCRFDCEESIKIAKKNLECMKSHSAELGGVVEGMLKCAIIYTRDRKVFLLRSLKTNGGLVCYNNIISNTNDYLYNALKQHKFIKALDKNNILLGDKNISDIGFMVFE